MNNRRGAPPSWFVILLGIAIVFGVYYLWLGLRNFVATGVTVVESTQQAVVGITSTARRVREIAYNAPTAMPSYTAAPPCQDFVVRVREAIVREMPNTASRIVDALREGETVCVIAALPDSDWYLIDEKPLTRRLDSVYMRRDIIRPLNPTATPTITLTPAPTDTPTRANTAPPMPTLPPVVRTAPPGPLPSDTPAPAPASVSL